jgi:hypothetical protein
LAKKRASISNGTAQVDMTIISIIRPLPLVHEKTEPLGTTTSDFKKLTQDDWRSSPGVLLASINAAKGRLPASVSELMAAKVASKSPSLQ